MLSILAHHRPSLTSERLPDTQIVVLLLIVVINKNSSSLGVYELGIPVSAGLTAVRLNIIEELCTQLREELCA